MVIFLQQLKMYDLSWAGNSSHRVAVIHEECNLQKKNYNDDLRNFIGNLNILGFLWSLVNRLLIYEFTVHPGLSKLCLFTNNCASQK